MAARRAAAGEGPRVAVNLKLPPDLRHRLELAAGAEERSLNNEIERRLERTLSGDAAPSDPALATFVGLPPHHLKLLACVRRVLVEAEEASGQSFAEKDGALARTIARRGLNELIKIWMGEDKGESDGHVSGRRADGSESLPNYDFSRSLAYAALRGEGLMKPTANGTGLYVTVGPFSFDD